MTAWRNGPLVVHGTDAHGERVTVQVGLTGQDDVTLAVDGRAVTLEAFSAVGLILNLRRIVGSYYAEE